jgi:outer membrane protein assembly factor BamB
LEQSLNKRDLSSVPNSPYVEAYINSKYLIINTETGKLVYNSSKESFWVFQSDFIPESNEYLLTLKIGENMAIALLDMQTGGLKWNTTVSKAKSLLSFSLKNLLIPILRKSTEIRFTTCFMANCTLDKSSGKLNWTAEEEYTKFFSYPKR